MTSTDAVVRLVVKAWARTSLRPVPSLAAYLMGWR